jgi:hypothetical protein
MSSGGELDDGGADEGSLAVKIGSERKSEAMCACGTSDGGVVGGT